MADLPTMHPVPVHLCRRDYRPSAPAELRFLHDRSVSWWEASISLTEVSHDEEPVPERRSGDRADMRRPGGVGAEQGRSGLPEEGHRGNYAEIEMGKLAQEKGASDSVRSFGKQLEQDHAAANTKAMDVAKQMGMTPPDGPNQKQ